MRCLVITSIAPPVPGRDAHAAYKRLGMFVRTMLRMGGRIEFLHFVLERFMPSLQARDRLVHDASEYWGAPVEVSVAPIGPRPESLWNHYGAGIFTIFDQPDFAPFSGTPQVAAVRDCLDRKPDLVLVQYLAAMCPLLRCGGALPPTVFDLDNLVHMMRLRSAFHPPIWPGKLVYAAHAPAILAAEGRGAARARATCVCSELDRRHLRRLGLRSNIVVVPNAVPIPARTAGRPAEKTLMFIGVYDYPPNVEAVEWLIGRVWPRVRQRVPDARLLIAGRGGEHQPVFQQLVPGVEFLGFVPDLDALYARTRVVCCPLKVGAGTRTKLIEAAAYGKPMVSTRLGAEGLEFVPDREILLRDADGEFADACVRLLEDDALADRLGSAARERMASIYDMAKIEGRIAGLMREALPP
ncbi:MAG: glycosyltransferase [Alphaproteobacteria bacterium]|nr:glycosyltransferase [Alphaproteobacteria bacterium]